VPALVLLAWLALVACGPGARRLRGSGARLDYGLYHGRLVRSGEPELGFRLLLYLAEPDGLHAELLPPIGGPRLIIDAGAGRIAITLPAERTSWVGMAERDSLSSVIGAAIEPGELVRFLQDGSRPAGNAQLVREPAQGRGMPHSFAISVPGYELSFTLRKRRRLESDPAALASGQPPPGMEQRPLGELVDLAPGGLLVDTLPPAPEP